MTNQITLTDKELEIFNLCVELCEARKSEHEAIKTDLVDPIISYPNEWICELLSTGWSCQPNNEKFIHESWMFPTIEGLHGICFRKENINQWIENATAWRQINDLGLIEQYTYVQGKAYFGWRDPEVTFFRLSTKGQQIADSLKEQI